MKRCPDPDRRVWTRESLWGWKPKVTWTRWSETGKRRHLVLAIFGRALVIDVFPQPWPEPPRVGVDSDTTP